MQRYFYHIDFGEHSADKEGTLLPSPEAARLAAVQLLGELLRDKASGFWETSEISISVTDETGRVFWRIDAVGTASSAAPIRASVTASQG